MVNLRFLTSTSRLRPDCVLTENSKIVIQARTKKWRMTGYRHSKSKIWVMNRVFVRASELNFLCEIFFRFFWPTQPFNVGQFKTSYGSRLLRRFI